MSKCMFWPVPVTQCLCQNYLFLVGQDLTWWLDQVRVAGPIHPASFKTSRSAPQRGDKIPAVPSSESLQSTDGTADGCAHPDPTRSSDSPRYSHWHHRMRWGHQCCEFRACPGRSLNPRPWRKTGFSWNMLDLKFGTPGVYMFPLCFQHFSKNFSEIFCRASWFSSFDLASDHWNILKCLAVDLLVTRRNVSRIW